MDEGVGDLRRRIVESIEERGPIAFSEYMEFALYAPGGFYDTPPVGPAGHFVTSPHVSELFARLLAGGLRELWQLLDRPHPFRIVEAGAGDGTLARQLHAHLVDLPIAYTALERSAGARDRLAQMPEVSVASGMSDTGRIEGGVVLANELLDNLPFRRIRTSAGEPAEVRVGLRGSRLVEIETACDPELVQLADRPTAGTERAIPTGALAFAEDLAGVLVNGYALLIDYEGGDDDLHGYQGHRVVEVDLDRPGTTDITAGVDMEAVAAHARGEGLRVFRAVSQAEALRSLGYDRWTAQERHRQGALLRGGAGIEAVRTWSSRNSARGLVDPEGLGRLRWLTMATAGLPVPSWIPRAPEAAPLDQPEVGG
jgi:SAM-dependent MidA family methyltransferase